MTNKPRSIGTRGESAVVKFLRTNGFPAAERAALHGSADAGDITGTPGVCWEVKSGKAAEACADGDLATWLAQTETERQNRQADVGVLITKRKGAGHGNAGAWWAWLPLSQIFFGALTELAELERIPVRLTLADVTWLLRDAGYGDPVADNDMPTDEKTPTTKGHSDERARD